MLDHPAGLVGCGIHVPQLFSAPVNSAHSVGGDWLLCVDLPPCTPADQTTAVTKTRLPHTVDDLHTNLRASPHLPIRIYNSFPDPQLLDSSHL